MATLVLTRDEKNTLGEVQMKLGDIVSMARDTAEKLPFVTDVRQIAQIRTSLGAIGAFLTQCQDALKEIDLTAR